MNSIGVNCLGPDRRQVRSSHDGYFRFEFDGRGTRNPAGLRENRFDLAGCEVRIKSLPGFVSNSIVLSSEHNHRREDVGIIVLSRLTRAGNATVTLIRDGNTQGSK